MPEALTSMRRCFHLAFTVGAHACDACCSGLKSAALGNAREEKRSPVGRLDFKSSKGRQPILGGFDSHSLPPSVHELSLPRILASGAAPGDETRDLTTVRRRLDRAEAFSVRRPC